MHRNRAGLQGLTAVEVEAGLPLIDQVLRIPVREAGRVGFLDLLPNLRVVKRLCRERVGGIVRREKIFRKGNAVLAEVDLRLHPVPGEAVDEGGGSHGNGQAHFLGKINCHLLSHKAAKGKSADDRASVAMRINYGSAVSCEVRNRPRGWWRCRASGAARIVGNAAESVRK